MDANIVSKAFAASFAFWLCEVLTDPERGMVPLWAGVVVLFIGFIEYILVGGSNSKPDAKQISG